VNIKKYKRKTVKNKGKIIENRGKSQEDSGKVKLRIERGIFIDIGDSIIKYLLEKHELKLVLVCINSWILTLRRS